VTVVSSARIDGFTVLTVTRVTTITLANTGLLTVRADDLGVRIGSTCYAFAWIGDFSTDKTVSTPSIVTLAVVIGSSLDIVEWNAFGVDVTVMARAWINWITGKPITIVSSLTGTIVVVHGAGESGSASGVGVAATIVNGARIDLDALVTILFPTVVTDTFVRCLIIIVT
jgi:hypothetical protein